MSDQTRPAITMFTTSCSLLDVRVALLLLTLSQYASADSVDNSSGVTNLNQTTAPEYRSLLYLKESGLTFQDLGADLSTSGEADVKSGIGYEVPCGVRKSASVRVVGGNRAHPGEFPWLASIQLLSGENVTHICGGAVLSSNWVITAGHCFNGVRMNMVSIVVGDHDLWKVEGNEQRRSVMRVVVRSDWDVSRFKNDLALLQLDAPLILKQGVAAPICLPLRTSHKHLKGEGLVAGWGRLSENGSHTSVLQFAEIPFMPLRRCHKVYSDLGYSEFLNKNQLCLGLEQGGKDSCQGDSGGPLVCRHADGRYYLCGLIGWGFGCARPNTPGIYTDVAPYGSWIKSVLNYGHDRQAEAGLDRDHMSEPGLEFERPIKE